MLISTETKVGIFVVAALGVFFYMAVQIDAFRVDTGNYSSHTVLFNDVSGLIRKADVKIAGVKVGWVDDITLVQSGDSSQAQAKILVEKRYVLRANASAVVRQDGLLGVKFLEITPGDSLLAELGSGSALATVGKSPASVDSLIQKFSNVADNVEQITDSLKDAIVGERQRGQIKEMVERFHDASQRIASFAQGMDRMVGTNEEDIKTLVSELRSFAQDLRSGYPLIQEDIRRIAGKVEKDLLPSLEENLGKISKAFDRDFDKVANKIEATASAIEEAALQTRDGFKSIGSVADKINEGKGLVGKLINEDETYQDLKVAVQGLKNYFARVESLGIVFDSHFESMYRPAENFVHNDSKGYLDMRIHPAEDRFYVAQIMGSAKGRIRRREVRREFYDQNDRLYDLSALNLSDDYKIMNAPRIVELVQERDVVKYGFQFGKSFNDIAFRFGLFENSFGAGVDYELPLGSDTVRWITTLEAFDLRGRDRIDDSRPHLKWINKIFFLRNFYFNYGADDFVSKDNGNVFFGMGLRFGDDDIKYFVSKLGLGAGKE